MIDSLDKRAKQVRARVAVRAWEYRQRKHSKGVWFRLRRVLADAAVAYAIPDVEAARLLSEGLAPEPVGAELEPARQIFFLSPERLGAMHDRREIPVCLGPGLLAERNIALVRFDLLPVLMPQRRGDDHPVPGHGVRR